jgi:type II secretory pathway predicted ATPase ExeA/cell division septation protein DedD
MNFVNDKTLTPVLDASASGAGPSASFIYEPFYGLREKPFSLSADPRFLFRSPAHGLAFDEVLAGIHRREGLIVLTGEIGTGKTTLCRSVLQHLDRRTFAAFVADPFVSREDLLKTLLVDFGVISIADLMRGRFNGASRSELSYPLYEFLDSLVPLQAFAVLVIDEAQNLSLPLLEEIRILSELECREKLLQVVLVGQPELRSSLRLPEMRQVDQRVSVRCELTALDPAGVAGYVDHRLKVAGRGESRVAFTRPALEAIYEGSSGIPRLINRICDRALQRAYASQTMQIDARFVRTAIGDLGLTAAAVFEERASHGKLSNASLPPAIADAPALPSVVLPAAAGTTQSVTAMPGLMAFRSEGDASRSHGQPIARSGTRHRWAAGAAATLLAVSASVGAAAWYTRAQPVDGQLVAASIPPPRPVLPQPVSVPPLAEPPAPESVPAIEAERAVRAPVAPTQPRGYSILVASFETRQRAERLVEELTNAGYGAHAVERDGGATHGPLTQVMVSGYTSAIEVQRDLQRIRELPGSYSDARIVGRD